MKLIVNPKNVNKMCKISISIKQKATTTIPIKNKKKTERLGVYFSVRLLYYKIIEIYLYCCSALLNLKARKILTENQPT